MYPTTPCSRFCRSLPTTVLAAVGFTFVSGLLAQPVSDVNLPTPVRGGAAIAALGAHLPDVARAYGLDAQALATLFQLQPSLGVDQQGSLLFVCEGLAVGRSEQRRAGVSDTGEVQDAMTPDSSVTVLANGGAVDAFQLHSLPGATRVIYLDFDGHVTRGTSWNSSFKSGADIVSQPFSLDADTANFSADERARIVAIWKRVAEDFAPFAIDVTTQDPGVEALRKSSSTDGAFGIRVVISPTNWYNSGAGGVAYIGSFSWSSDTPCFAFSDQLAKSEKYIAEAVSHEAGHGLSLYHDGLSGTSPTEYYSGQGNWAPIMGVGYYKSLTQFSKGEYANANNLQDDLTVIETHAPRAGDDHGGTTGAATILAVPTVNSGGTIERTGDVDVFRFDTGAGAISLSIVSPANESNLHMNVQLLDASGQVVAQNAATALNATFTPTLAAGSYYIRVTGVGYGTATTTGYSNYGSVGNYVIKGSVVPIEGFQSPQAVVTAAPTSGLAPLPVAFNGAGSSDPDGSIASYLWNFGNGATSTEVNPTYTYSEAGNFTAILTVTDNAGLSNSASVLVSVTAPPNQAPTAAVSASTTSGVAPLPVVFSSAGSVDPDGSIAAYLWNFGDGTTSSAAAPTKTYATAGNYNATLTVTDNRGATATASIGIAVARDPATDVDVAQYSLARVTSNAGVSAAATVEVRDRAGRVAPNVTVAIQWSGLVSGTTSGTTDSSGRVIIKSGRTKKSGTITGAIKTVTPPTGIVYDANITTTAPSSLSITTK